MNVSDPGPNGSVNRGPILRFALYAGVSAGKTCYLAALAMDRIANSRGYSCDWLYSADDCPPPPAQNTQQWLEQHPDAALYQGKKALEASIKAFKDGELPEPTRNVTYRYRFVFRGEEYKPPCGFDVHLIPDADYVGCIPSEGTSLVVVANVGGMLHFRVFDGQSRQMVDKNESDLSEKARDIEYLKNRLQSLWSSTSLVEKDRKLVVHSIASIVGLPPSERDEPQPRLRNYQVELIDYSGELINPHLSDDVLARKVRDHLREADGLIVLAEAPRPGQDLVEQGEAFARVRVAFEGIRSAKWDNGDFCPVALVMNKWDRRRGDPGSDPAVIDARVAAFLDHSDPEPPHRRLRDALRAAVGPDNFRVFAASAFGSHRIVKILKDGTSTEQERPASGDRLAAYGLEDPFMWLARRRENLLLDRLRTQVSRLSAWKIWQLMSGPRHRLAQALTYTKSLTRESGEHQAEIERLGYRALQSRAKQIGVLAMGLALLTFAAGSTWTYQTDRRDFGRIAHLPESLPQSPGEEELRALENAQDWYAKYRRPSLWRWASRLGVLSARDAGIRLSKVSDEAALLAKDLAYMKRLQDTVSTIKTEVAASMTQKKLDEAEKRLIEFSGQEGLPDAIRAQVEEVHTAVRTRRGEIAALEAEKKREEQILVLEAIGQEIAGAATLEQLDEAEKRLVTFAAREDLAAGVSAKVEEQHTAAKARRSHILGELEKDKYKGQDRTLEAIGQEIAGAATQERLDEAEKRLVAFASRKDLAAGVSAKLEEQKTAVKTRRAQILEALALSDLKDRYRAACDAFKVADAAVVLTQLPVAIKGTRREIEDLKDNFRRHASDLVAACIQHKVRGEHWDDAAKELRTIVTSVAVKELLGEDLTAELGSPRNEWRMIWDPQERFYYNHVRNSRTSPACASYLSEVEKPSQDVKSAVQRYAAYIKALDTPTSYTLIVEQLDWGQNSSGYTYYLSIDVNNTTVMNQRKLPESSQNTIHEVGQKGALPSLRPQDRIALTVKLIYNNKPWHEAKAEYIQLEGLREKKIVELSKQYGAKIWIRVTDLPTEPPLPDFDIILRR